MSKQTHMGRRNVKPAGPLTPLESAIRAASGPAGLHITSLWYEQVTASDVEHDSVRVVLKTGAGDFSQFFGSVCSFSYHRARKLAERIGVDLVVQYGLRERVAGWAS